jgi:hypothetical protein
MSEENTFSWAIRDERVGNSRIEFQLEVGPLSGDDCFFVLNVDWERSVQVSSKGFGTFAGLTRFAQDLRELLARNAASAVWECYEYGWRMRFASHERRIMMALRITFDEMSGAKGTIELENLDIDPDDIQRLARWLIDAARTHSP